MDPEASVAELRAAVQELRSENAGLWNLVRELALCKQGNARYPYWNWMCEQLVDDLDRTRLERVFSALNDVAGGDEPSVLMLRSLPESVLRLVMEVESTRRVDRSAFGTVVEEIVGELEPADIDDLLSALGGQGLFPRLLAAIED